MDVTEEKSTNAWLKSLDCQSYITSCDGQAETRINKQSYYHTLA